MSLSLDIKYAARLLNNRPGFTALMITIVAIGLGLTLYTFSLLNGLLFKPLSFNDNKPVYAVESIYDHTHLSRRRALAFDMFDIQKDKTLFEEVGFYDDGVTFVGGVDSSLRKFNSNYVTWNLFSFTGVQPIMGRVLQPEDHHEGAEQVIVIGYDMWQSYFNGEPEIIGRVVSIDGAESATIVGVMPEGFAFPSIAQMWQPLPQSMVAPTERSYQGVYGFAKLADGVSLAQAKQRLDAKSAEIASTIPDDYRWAIRDNNKYLSIEPFKKANITQYYGMFIALFIVVFLILALACINVGNLLLARVNERIKEVAIRVALGVPQKRLILQMLWESVFICSIGGVFAFLLAGWGLEVTNQVLDGVYQVDKLKPFWWNVSLDSQAIMVLIGSMLAMILITGLIPAWRSIQGDFNAILRDGTRGAIGKKAAMTSKVLVISEILLSCVVLIMATVLLVSSYSAGVADYGVDTQNRLTAQLQLPTKDYPIRRDTEFEYQDRLNRSKFYYDLIDELATKDSIKGSIVMTQLPGTGGGTSHFAIQGREKQELKENPYSNNEGVSRGSFTTLGMEIVQGRDFDHRDIGEDVHTIIINESITRDFFPDGNAVGQKVRQLRRDGSDTPWNTIVGVVSDSFHGSTMDFSSASYNSYHPMDNWGLFRGTIAVHYTGDEAEARKTLYDAVNRVNSKVGIYHVQSYDALIQKPILLILAVSKIFLLCGAVAVFLAASGIYAVAANSVQQRSQEIGIRRALGASDSNIIKLFMGQAGWQLAIGLVIGISFSIWLISLMSNTMIFNSNSYLLGVVGMPLFIAAMVLIATYTPTKRVIEKEPSEALHQN